MKKWFSRNTLIVVAALALLASLVSGREKPAVEVMQEKKPRTQVVEDIDVSKLERPEAALPASDPFAPRSFASQQPIPQQTAKQGAPALPFRYFGKVIEDGKLEVFLMHGDQHVAVAAGAKIAEYRVDHVSEKSITFTYLPLNTRQTLDIPAAN